MINHGVYQVYPYKETLLVGFWMILSPMDSHAQGGQAAFVASNWERSATLWGPVMSHEAPAVEFV